MHLLAHVQDRAAVEREEDGVYIVAVPRRVRRCVGAAPYAGVSGIIGVGVGIACGGIMLPKVVPCCPEQPEPYPVCAECAV